ncbi:MBL fold metallo-hydrolase [Synergistales bacterium]|nr:MBL fold metallo-hydrolase [Synergistales bacterium]
MFNVFKFDSIESQGELKENCYLFWCAESLEAAVIDPGDRAERILSRLRELGLKVRYILLTHGHHDHIGAVAAVQAATGAVVAIHRLEARPKHADWYDGAIKFEDGQEIRVGQEKLKVLHTPGHTPGGVCFWTKGIVFSGDTLFHTDVGYSNFPGGNFADLERSIREKLYVLDESTEVYPGHEESTTIGEEKWHNTVVRA